MNNNPNYALLAEWSFRYRRFISRQQFLGRWPFQNDEERKKAWREWIYYSVYKVGE